MIKPTKVLSMATGDDAVVDTCRYIIAVILNPGNDASACTINDDITSGGTEVVKLVGSGNGNSVVFTPCNPIGCSVGVRIGVTGTGASVKVVVM